MTQLAITQFEAATLLLDRHEQRRRQRIPTMGVVAGPSDAPARLVRRWARLSRLAVCETRRVELADLVTDWFVCLAGARNLPAAACAWLAERTGRDGGEMWRAFRTRSAHERKLYLDRLLGAAAVSPAERACRTIVEHACHEGSTTIGLWDRLLAACMGDVSSLFAGVAAMLEDGGPALFINLSAGAVPEAFDSACKSLTELTILSPRSAVLASVSDALLEAYLASAPESHAVALVREGAIRLEGADEQAGDCEPQGLRDEAEPSERRADAATPDVHVAAESPLQGDDDPARSRAERYLFERLQSHGETAGLFEINGLVPAPTAWGGRLEVDLVARSVKVAVEIDGYFHFQDLEAYRRDRRKDALLQQEGYFVVRGLADDVVSGLEEIVETIVAAVRLRRRRSSPREEQS